MEKYLNVYFGSQSNYYTNMYKEFLNGRKFTFNVISFFFGPFWFLYRKLYIQGLLLLLLAAAVEQLGLLVLKHSGLAENIQTMIYLVLNLSLSMLAGFMGNYLYMRKMEKNMEEVIVATENEEQRIKLLQKKGGTWILAYVIGGLLLIIVNLFLRK